MIFVHIISSNVRRSTQQNVVWLNKPGTTEKIAEKTEIAESDLGTHIVHVLKVCPKESTHVKESPCHIFSLFRAQADMQCYQLRSLLASAAPKYPPGNTHNHRAHNVSTRCMSHRISGW